MRRQLEIEWAGEARGLDQHRLSVAEFAEPLGLLLKALRRIAHRVQAEISDAEPATDAGRLSDFSKWIDIEIHELKGGSLSLHADVTFAPPPSFLSEVFETTVDRSVSELLDGLSHEGQGRLYNGQVRRYLAKLPQGLASQRYTYRPEGGEPRVVEIGDLRLAEESLGDLPFLVRLQGYVAGVGFEPGKFEVQFKTDQGRYRLPATENQVELALSLRGELCHALALDGPRRRLLTISREEPMGAPSPEMVSRYVFDRWRGLHERLAR